MMERSTILSTMADLKLYGMRSAYDEIIATAIKRQHEPQQLVGDLLTAEISEKQARSIKYQITIAKLPLAKDIGDFDFDGVPVNETLVRDLAGGNFIAHQRNVVLVGGTGTGKTHLAIAIIRACIRAGARGRFFNVVDLVNKLEQIFAGQIRISRIGQPCPVFGDIDRRRLLAHHQQNHRPPGLIGRNRQLPQHCFRVERLRAWTLCAKRRRPDGPVM